MLVEYLSDIYQCFIVLECQFSLYQTFKSILLILQQKTSLLYILYCNGVFILVEYLSDIYQCLIVIECQLFLYQTFKSLLLILQQKNSIQQQSYHVYRVFIRNTPILFHLRVSVSSVSYFQIYFTSITMKKFSLQASCHITLAGSGPWLCPAVQFPFCCCLKCYYCAKTSVNRPRHHLSLWTAFQCLAE